MTQRPHALLQRWPVRVFPAPVDVRAFRPEYPAYALQVVCDDVAHRAFPAFPSDPDGDCPGAGCILHDPER